MCHPWSENKCNTKRFFQYIGSDLDHGGHYPFMVDTVLVDGDKFSFEGRDFTPFNALVIKCNEPALGKDKCSCDSCPESCSN